MSLHIFSRFCKYTAKNKDFGAYFKKSQFSVNTLYLMNCLISLFLSNFLFFPQLMTGDCFISRSLPLAGVVDHALFNLSLAICLSFSDLILKISNSSNFFSLSSSISSIIFRRKVSPGLNKR